VAVLRVGHLGICVRDLERSIAFYRDVLGFRPLTQVDVRGTEADRLLRLPNVEQRTVFLERDGVRLALFAYRQPSAVGDGEPRAMNAVGFAALMLRVDDVDAMVAQCRERGVRVLDDTRTDYPAYRSKLVFVCDPDGTLIELVEIPGDPYTPFGTPYQSRP
jgi:catechol 2,3-dioxygenase-like lactoylglutathione lyase family enzyme